MWIVALHRGDGLVSSRKPVFNLRATTVRGI
jgi:hypothetical protein